MGTALGSAGSADTSNPMGGATAGTPWAVPAPPPTATSLLGGAAPSEDGGVGALPVPATDPSSPRPRRLLRPLLVALGVLVSVSLLVALVHALLFRPWLDRPEDEQAKIERHFRTIREWAQPPRHTKRGDPQRLIAAAQHVANRPPTQGGQGKIPLVKDKLSKEQQEAIDALMAWSRAGGPFPTSPCTAGSKPVEPSASASADMSPPQPSTPLPPPATSASHAVEDTPAPPAAYYALGRLALETARRSRRLPPRVSATLRLAHEMRLVGDPDEYLVGLELAVDAARWLPSRDTKPDNQFRALQPRVAELRGTLARAAVCTVTELEGLDGWGFDARARFGPTESSPPFGFVSYPRERLVVMSFFATTLGETPRAPTIEALLSAFSAAPKPRSVALEATLPGPGWAEKVQALHAEYEKLVPAPQRSPRSTNPRSRTRRRRPSRTQTR